MTSAAPRSFRQNRPPARTLSYTYRQKIRCSTRVHVLIPKLQTADTTRSTKLQRLRRLRPSSNARRMPPPLQIQKPIIVASIYRPPNNPIDPFLSSLDRCLRRTNRLHEHYTLLAGDFNARNSCWYGGDTTDDAGENLHQLFSLFSLEQLNHFPTNLYADQLKSCLDLVSTNIPLTHTRSLQPLGNSDHLSIVGSIYYYRSHRSTHP